ncbi:bifunctional diaminohydroxyphosphoribosylaminopyrimidine deaminase/5-amino-6-(5-phosphoribosylamino)uracil reductase RibD [Aliiglaciecola litoralis]|uniref:Riboflavin biosynthesis protein RibD n=1 Tax=Aliiglaciecola litoralis TaxID=582857 RepID=A0ABN1LMZ7_9ALTE
MSLPTFSASDHQFMALALQLAEKGRYTTTPNPNVGCVIVNQHQHVVGQGWHYQAGTPHAEIHALNMAGKQANNATAYVTLEPCSHTGRTGPCADALIKAGVKRVVAAMVDPNPQVSGRGLAKLAEQGIAVSHGLMEQQARNLNRGFIKRMTLSRPWVTLKLAASLDGKTALANGASQWITDEYARQDVQRHRAMSCAILTGSGTALADNPSLNVRYDELGQLQEAIDPKQLRQPLRVVLDGKNQLTDKLKMFGLDGLNMVINRTPNRQLPAHVQQQQVGAIGNKLDLKQVLSVLAEQQINQLWVEAGGLLAGALVEQNLVDELILYQAPKLLGDKGQNLFVMSEMTTMSEAKRLRWSSIKQVGDSLKLTAEFSSVPV